MSAQAGEAHGLTVDAEGTAAGVLLAMGRPQDAEAFPHDGDFVSQAPQCLLIERVLVPPRGSRL
jgi:hypothetical protein